MTARVGMIPHPDRLVPCCECPTTATHMAFDVKGSALCNTHLPAWMAWRGLHFDYLGAA